METSDRHAIILSSSVSVKSAPAYKSTDLFIIHEGLKIEVTGQDGDWLRICLPDGKVGWIPADMASVI
ncbi:MAG: SH3 domain-containing protein [Gammaproteobacteria bacterium]|nr:SH3 domain-containing protein [Gammaproteobacteria bacterium]NIR92586.1 SH3 domain-containing protein [Gammaproteobacteria bacterium]NIW39475.1 SH3 domain-containing protein [candidate division Zixibacteria bacterium]NIX54529.1 SH3 domain-containing protein [candidate division Zixibacteria bacterium]